MKLAQDDSRSPKLLTTFRHPMEAEQLVNKLRENEIEALTTGTSIATGAIEFAQVDVEVLVPSEQLELARKVMADSQQANDPPINWDEVDWRADSDEHEVAGDTIESTIGRLIYSSNQNPSIGNWFVLITGFAFFAWAVWAAFALFGT